MLKLSTFIFYIIYHFGQKNIVSVVIFSLGNLCRTGWSVFSASEIGFECEFCIKRNTCQSFCFSKSLRANYNFMSLNARDNRILSPSMKNLVFLHRNIPLFTCFPPIGPFFITWRLGVYAVDHGYEQIQTHFVTSCEFLRTKTKTG